MSRESPASTGGDLQKLSSTRDDYAEETTHAEQNLQNTLDTLEDE